MSKYTFSRFVYFDTNILSHLAKNRHLWKGLYDFLEENDLTLGISNAQRLELSDANKLHQNLVELFISGPSAVLKTWDMILAEEVRAHPQRRADTLLLYPINALLLQSRGLKKLEDFFSARSLNKERRGQLWHAQQMAERHAELKSNFQPS